MLLLLKVTLSQEDRIGIDPLSFPSEDLNPECLPPVERSDLFSYLVWTTSHYTNYINDQLKNYKSLEAYNQVVSGFVASVKGKVIVVRRSQRMNGPLVELWVIAESNGSIFSAHCVGCEAGLAESCPHVASVLFYIYCWTRINGKLACSQVKGTWLLPTYVGQVSYVKAKDIDFSSAKKKLRRIWTKKLVVLKDAFKTSLTLQLRQILRSLRHSCRLMSQPMKWKMSTRNLTNVTPKPLR